jgi:hypothetical protein
MVKAASAGLGWGEAQKFLSVKSFKERNYLEAFKWTCKALYNRKRGHELEGIYCSCLERFMKKDNFPTRYFAGSFIFKCTYYYYDTEKERTSAIREYEKTCLRHFLNESNPKSII